MQPKKQRCTHCKEVKPMYAFGKNRSRGNGYHHRCLDCCREYDRIRFRIRDKKPEYIKKRKEREQTESFKEKRRARNRLDYWENKHKYTAKKIVENLIKLGKLKREPCVVCGNKKVEGHHPDYTKPEDVIWLCHKHHAEVHRKPPLH